VKLIGNARDAQAKIVRARCPAEAFCLSMIFSDLPPHADHAGRDADGVAALIAAAGRAHHGCFARDRRRLIAADLTTTPATGAAGTSGATGAAQQRRADQNADAKRNADGE
jgi:hypothetical protein